MPSVASNTARKIIDEFIIARKDVTITDFVRELKERRDGYSNTCHKILIFLCITLIFIAAHVLYGMPNLEIAGAKLELNDRVAFFGFIVGNMLFVLQIGAFFKVVVLEKVLHWCWNENYPSKILDRVILSHNALIGHALRDTEGGQNRMERIGSWYIHNFFAFAYSAFYFYVLYRFVENLLLDALSLDWWRWLPYPSKVVDPEKMAYVIVLILVNAASTSLTIWLLRDMRPLSADWSKLKQPPVDASLTDTSVSVPPAQS
jgi:hypothetical protein